MVFSMKRPVPSLIFVFITLLLDVLGIGLIIPVAPRLIAKLQGLDIDASHVTPMSAPMTAPTSPPMTPPLTAPMLTNRPGGPALTVAPDQSAAPASSPAPAPAPTPASAAGSHPGGAPQAAAPINTQNSAPINTPTIPPAIPPTSAATGAPTAPPDAATPATNPSSPVAPAPRPAAARSPESKAAKYVGLLMATYAVMQFIFAPILGSLSDRFGRRPVILISLFGSGIDYIAAAFAPSLAFLFVTRAINGISGANMTSCSAYIADVTPPEKRAAGYGMIGAAFGIGFVFGPLMGGFLGDPTVVLPLIGPGDVHHPFIAAGILTLINWLYGVFVLPESLAPRNRRAFSWKKANPVGALAWVLKHRIVATLAVSLFLVNLAQLALHSTWVLSTGLRFGWSAKQVGWSLFVVGISSAIVQGGLARKIIPAIGERASLLFGVIIAVFAFAGYGLATHGWMIYCIIAAASIGGISGPAVQAIISKAIPPNEQGLLQGALTGLQSVSAIIGPLAGAGVFAYFTSPEAPVQLPGASFFLSSLLTLLAIVPILLVWKRMPASVKQAPIVDEAEPSAAV